MRHRTTGPQCGRHQRRLGFFLYPSSVTTVLFDERSKNWAVPRCIGLGELSHLYANNLPPQPSGIKANYD